MAARKWTPEVINNLRRRRAAGEKLKDLAAEFGVSAVRIFQLTGKVSRHRPHTVHPARMAWLRMRDDFITWAKGI